MLEARITIVLNSLWHLCTGLRRSNQHNNISCWNLRYGSGKNWIRNITWLLVKPVCLASISFSESLGYLQNIVMTNEEQKRKENKMNIGYNTKGEAAYGWRKCSKSQARRMVTEFSGSPLCGLQAFCGIMPYCWKARCCLSCWSMYRRRVNLPSLPDEFSSSPSFFLMTLIWSLIASFRHRKCREIVWRATAV